MNVDDTLLLAYVDRTLPVDQVEALDRLMEADAVLAARVAQIKASDVDYRDAFSHQAMPPIPAALLASVRSMSESSGGEAVRQAPADSGRVRRERTQRAETGGPSQRYRPWWPSLFAAFCTGAVACLLTLYVTGIDPTGASSGAGGASQQTLASSSSAAPRWIKAAAGYQALFDRETLADGDVTEARKQQTIDAIRAEDRLALQLPDLARAGLSLKAVLRLRYHGEPLIQVVYLPKAGAPIALCIMKAASARGSGGDEAGQRRFTVENMDVLSWQAAGLQYALIAKPGSTDLSGIAKAVGVEPAI